MGYASRSGRAVTNPNDPASFAPCQRCGIWYNRRTLKNQHDWRGPTLLPLYIFVCPPCYDTPQEQLRSIVVAADPVPIYLALTEPFLQDESNFLTVSAPTVYDPITGIPIPSTTVLITQDDQPLTSQVIGEPVGLDQNAVMPLLGTVHYGVPLNLISVVSNGITTINVTCGAPHGLTTKDQISVEGLTQLKATGFFSVTVTGALSFTYETGPIVPSGSLLTSTTRMVTALIGLPRGYDTIPQTGV